MRIAAGTRAMIYTVAVMITLFATNGAKAQLQRLALIPQDFVKMAPGESAVLQSMTIDYYRQEPSPEMLSKVPAYNQVFSEGLLAVAATVNGEAVKKTFKELVESEDPMFLLEPQSDEFVRISLNPAYSGIADIKLAEVEIVFPIIIGNQKDDKDVDQARLIFDNFGSVLSQDIFRKLAQCLDLLKAENKLAVDENGLLTDSSITYMETVFAESYLDSFDVKDFKYLVDTRYIHLGKDLTKFGAHLAEVYGLVKAYKASISQLSKSHTERMKRFLSPYSNDATVTDFPASSYQKLLQLRDVNDEKLRDTVIGGSRYILMTAWKSAGFWRYVDTTSDALPAYTSDKAFFKYALFMTSAQEMKQWALSHKLNTYNEGDARLRLKQALGLPPNASNNLFFEFWVKPGDIFRPTLDSSLSLDLVLKNLDTTYEATFYSFLDGSYASEMLLKNYPFTGVGYTYDWSAESSSHVGLSEFVLRENRKIYVRRVLSTDVYLKN